MVMHSTERLTSASFAFAIDGRPATFDAVLPGWDERDRLGVVARQPCGAVGASLLVLAAVTAFYDGWRRRAADFFAYPDFYVFHVGARLGNHGMLDVWPDHKEVVVPRGGEDLLRSINDRAITRLLVPDAPPAAPRFERQTLASASIRSALAYAPSGRVANADIEVAGDGATEDYVAAVLDRSGPLDDATLATLRAGRAALLRDGRPVEAYRRLTLDEALALLG
jgi:hypothetical protein